MTHPNLPHLPEPAWPVRLLEQFAHGAGAALGVSWMWFVLRNQRGEYIPRVAVQFAPGDHGVGRSVDPASAPRLLISLTAQLAQSAQAGGAHLLPLHDVRQYPQLASLVPADPSIREIIGAPIITSGAFSGALVISRATPYSFTEAEQRLLLWLTAQAAQTIELAIAADGAAAQTREMSALLSASRALTSTLDATEVFGAIIDAIRGVITCESALIFQYDAPGELLRVVAGMAPGVSRLEGSTIMVADERSKAALVARSGDPFIGVVGPEDDIGPHTGALVRDERLALLCAPLISKGQLRGVASVARKQAFESHEISAMERLSPIAAAALENVTLYLQERAARVQQEAIFASASDGVALVDEGRRFTQVNTAFARYLGADPSALIGQVCCATLEAVGMRNETPAGCALCKGPCLLLSVMTTGAQRDHVECELAPPLPPARQRRNSMAPASRARIVDFSLTRIPDGEGRQRLLLLGRDITASREVQRLRAEFLHMVTHEIRSPLHAINGILKELVGEQTSPEEQFMALTNVRAAVLRLTALVDDLAMVARRDAGQWSVNPTAHDLAQVARDIVHELEPLARTHGVRLAVNAPAGLPLAIVDPLRAEQVVRNLLINAIRFTPEGGLAQVSVEAEPEWVVLRVSDTGIGIPRGELDRIWDRYYQAATPDGRRPGGQGLGLAIVRIIVEAHNGKKDVQSKPGSGSTFIIHFPRATRG